MARRELSYYDTDRRRGGPSRHGRSRGRGRNRNRSRTRRGYGTGGGDKRRRFSVPDWAMAAISLAVALGVALAWMARWINPATYGFMSGAGLFMPILFVANFLCLLYWIIRWRRGVLIPLPVFVAGLFGMTMFFRPELTRSYGNDGRDRSLVSVTTYNVRGMMRTPESRPGKLRSNMREVVSIVDSLKPDILCMQEFQSTALHPRSRFEEALPQYTHKRFNLNIKSSDGQRGWGNAIYSRLPITGSGHIDFEDSSNSVLWADISTGRDTVRVFNVHLQTTSIKADDERYIVEGDFIDDTVRTSHFRKIAGNLTRNAVIRARQADIVADSIAASPYRVVVCGDFNDTPVSYAYRKISRGLRDCFREAGRGYGYTYRGFFNMLRIDYVLHSPSIECVEYASPSFSSSDHNPVAVKIRIN